MLKHLIFFLFFSSITISLFGTLQEYTGPRDVATTEGLPSSLVNQSVCAISGEYTDSMVDVVIPGPEPLVLSRVYNSSSAVQPWSFNHYDRLILGNVIYENSPSYIIALRQPSGAQLDYVFDIANIRSNQKQVPFKLVVPKGLTNGGSRLSGKTNIRNQKVYFYPKEEQIIAHSGAGDQKKFCKIDMRSQEGWPIWGQTSEEKINGGRIRYEGAVTGICGAEQIFCENKKNNKEYSSLKFSEKRVGEKTALQTITTSDQRKLLYYFEHHHYKIKEKGKNNESSYPVDRFYLTKVDHPHAPIEEYRYEKKSLSEDKHITRKQRDKGNRFLNIDYYHEGRNRVGGEVGEVEIQDKNDFRLNRVKRLEAPVGHNTNSIPIYRFDYHVPENKKSTHGHTDVYDAKNHKIRYCYDQEHRLTAIIRYTGKDRSSYRPYSEEDFVWNENGCLIAKYFKDGSGNIHHARLFTYDSRGNVQTSTLCGKLTGKESPPILLNRKGNLIENGYERETKTYTYSNDYRNLLLTETDTSGKTIRYAYLDDTSHPTAKFLSYDGKIQLREFYFYDENYSLIKTIIDDGCKESHDDLSFVTERQYQLSSPRQKAPVGLPESVEAWAFDMFDHGLVPLKKSQLIYSRQGQLESQQVFDGERKNSYNLSWDYDLHGNVIQEINALGITIHKKYDLATDNLIEEELSDVVISNTYDFANRLIERKETHPDQTLTTHYHYDYLGNCKKIIDSFGQETHQIFDDFGRVIEIHYPQVLKEGVLTHPIVKKEYDIAGFLTSTTDANGRETRIEVNIRGQPTHIFYPDGTQEKMVYSVEGWLVEKENKTGTRTQYIRDSLGRITEEIVDSGTEIKRTIHEYNALHLLKTIDPEGGIATYSYDAAGRLKETLKNGRCTKQLYDSFGRLSEIREYFGDHPKEYRATIKKYDILDRITEEILQTSDGITLHYSSYDYDVRGNCTLVQSGDQKTITEYNTCNQPILIIDGLGQETHISYNTHFVNLYGQRVLQKTTTDPMGYRTVETYDAANRLVEVIQLDLFGEKMSRQIFLYDLVGNQTGIQSEVIENGKVARVINTLFSYNLADQPKQIIEAAGLPEQKITTFIYNSLGQKEKLIKPDGKEIAYAYDGFDRLKKCTSSDRSIAYHYTYDLLDQVTAITDKTTGKTTKRSYFNGELEQETLANGLSLQYTYDRTGRARTVTFPDQTGVEYIYNAVDLKEIHRVNKGNRVYTHCDVEHSLSGQILRSKIPGKGDEIFYEFDPLNRCTSITSSNFHQQIPINGFDKAGNLLKCETQNIPYTFSYDSHYHLKKETGHATHTYSFDSLSNRTSKNGEPYQYNGLNQIVNQKKEVVKYDLNGNLIAKGSYKFYYDALNRLVKIAHGEQEFLYAYDPFDRRISKTVNGEEELFLFQGQDEIGRWKNGICQEVRLLGKNPYSRTVAIEIDHIPYIPLHDMKGNVVSLLDMQGSVIEQYRYTAYGETEILTPSGQQLSHSAIHNPWQYAGKRIDEESGLIAFGMRYYDPSLGRWITPDPAGFIDGPNLYAYVHNNPLQYFDKYGLFAESLFSKSSAYKAFEYFSFGRFCTLLKTDQPPEGDFIQHFCIEDKLEEHYNFNKKAGDEPFQRTATYCVNDFVNSSTNTNYNFKEMPANKKILFVNGICNTFQDFKDSMIYLAGISGYNVQGVFCPTFGFSTDAICFLQSLNKGAAFEGTREIQKNIREFHEQATRGATMLIIGHSRGCSYINNSLKDVSQKFQKRADVRAFAPGAFIHKSLCNTIIHYESSEDIVPFLDLGGRWRCRDTIVTLQPHAKVSAADHEFISSTYRASLKTEIKEYMRKK